MKEKYDFKGVLGFILFVYAKKNKAKEMIRVGFLYIYIYIYVCVCKYKISQLQKIKQLKRKSNNLYFNFFRKEYPLILSSLNLT